MPTPAHTDYDSNKPAAGGNPTAFGAGDLDNQRALRDMIIAGMVPGFIESRLTGTGPGTDRPQYLGWQNFTLGIGFRWNMTWTGFQVTSVQEEWSNDLLTTATWTAIGAPMVLTYDGTAVSTNNLLTSTVHGGFVVRIFELWAKVGKLVSDFVAHVAATGTSVHGLGTMSTQNASAIAATGGTANAVVIGGTTRAAGSFTRIVEDKNTLSPTLNAGVVVDWAYGGSVINHNGTNAITSFSNVPTGVAGHAVYVTAFNNITWPGVVSWGAGGIPSIAGPAWVSLGTMDAGAAVVAAVMWS